VRVTNARYSPEDLPSRRVNRAQLSTEVMTHMASKQGVEGCVVPEPAAVLDVPLGPFNLFADEHQELRVVAPELVVAVRDADEAHPDPR
jgi:hypothetical protein